MSIRLRLAWAFLVMTGLVVLTGTALLFTQQVGERYALLGLRAARVGQITRELQVQLNRHLRAMDFFLLLGEASDRQRFEETGGEVRRILKEWQEVTTHEPSEWIDYRQVARAYDRFRQTADQVITLRAEAPGPALWQLLERPFLTESELLKRLVDQTVQQDLAGREAVSAQGRRVRQLGLNVALVFSALAILMALGLAWWIFRSVAQPLRVLIKAAESIGQGDLTVRLAMSRRHEIGQLALALNQMAENLERLQTQVIQMHRMSALGQVAGGVAHELNNPLTGVLGPAQLLKQQLPLGNPHREMIERIEASALRCRKIVRELLDFARPTKLEMEEVNLTALWEDTLALCHSDLSVHNITVQKNLLAGLPLVRGSRQSLQQVFLNLVTNAWQAMPGGGTLTITTRLVANGWVETLVADTGLGIPRQHLTRVFEPFFTTKETGHGTGLGLSVSYGLIQRHGGSLEAQSEGAGKGTTFVVRLPSVFALPAKGAGVSPSVSIGQTLS
ncbi:MAG: HAMP domain-containing protein [Elusimicrobia bacterium]|nr:HAMP domain-containing protein [Elusimicrobiota bacterium]